MAGFPGTLINIAAMDDVRWLTEEEQRLWRRTLQFHQLMDLAVDRQLERDAGLSLSDYSVLVTLSEGDELGLRARTLGERLGWDRSRVSHQVRRMEKRGLVEKNACETDGRGTMVGLTSLGQEALEAVAPQHVELVRSVYIDGLDEEELRTLDRIFSRVIEKVGEKEGIVIPGSTP